MIAKDYRALASDLKKQGVFKPRSVYGFATVGAELAVFGISFAALMHVEAFGVAYFALHAFLGWSMFRFFVLVHEAGHRSLFHSRIANDVTGLIASIFCFVPFYPWRSIHHLHHKWVGVIDKDPTQNELVGLKQWGAGKNLFFRVIWFSWIPVMFLVFIFRLFWGQPIRDFKKGETKQAWLGLLSIAVILAPRIALALVFGWKWALVWLGPMAYAYLFVNEQVSLPQHTGLFPFLSHDHPEPIPFHEQDSVSRSTATPGIFSVVMSYNFNLHNEHHLFPSVPWYWLPRVTERIATEPTYRKASVASFMLSIRTKDPVAVYTKALPPHGRAPEDIDDDDSGASGAHDIVPAS